MKQRVLIVDDSPTALSVLKMLLADKELDIHTAMNGREALELAERCGPALIIMDVMMPEMNGLDALRRLRAIPKFARTPIIMVTASRQNTDLEEGYAAGCDGYLIKPFKAKELLAMIERYLEAPALLSERSASLASA